MEQTNFRFLAQRKHFSTDLAAYWLAQNPTPGTGFAMGITTSYSAQAPFITMFNSAPVTTGIQQATVTNPKRMYLDYIRLINSAVGASSTSGHIVAVMDSGNKYVSGTASTPTPVNMLYDVTLAPASQPLTSVMTINVGPITAAASTAPRLAGRAVLRSAASPAWVLYDEIVLHFGEDDTGEPQGVTATTATRIDVFMPPVILGPQATFLLCPFNVANAVTAPSFEYEIGYWER